MGFEHLILHLLKSRWGRIVVSLLCLAACSFFGALAWPNVADARRLRHRHQFCMANVIDHRYTSGLHYFDGSYDLRYAFRLQPNGALFEQREKGPLARKEIWSSLPKGPWQEAVRSGKVSVAYCVDDPAINTLERDVDSNYYALSGFGIVTAIGAMASLLWLVRLITQPNWSAFDRGRGQLSTHIRA